MTLIVAAVITLVIGGASHGWGTVPAILPIPVAVGIWIYLNAGRDTDYGAALRRELDERQRLQRLKAQALVGRVLAAGLGVAYLIALATGSEIWPWAVGVGLMAVTFIIGFVAYGEGGWGVRRR
ncbi:MAG TPA: hypothetical protein VHO06_01965 [Polyangia bacterium]|nr:hypothetical protein [Polyangia bacterium]